MATQVQNRRGTTAEHSTFTGAVGELTVDTDKDVVVVHDGSTAGGVPQMRENGSNSALVLGSAGTPSLKFTGDTNTGIYSPGADQVAISTGGSGRLFVNSSGQVGIGSSTPGRKLVVAGDLNTVVAVEGSTSGTSNLFLGDTADEDVCALSYNHQTNSLGITVNASASPAVTIDSSGRLLSGTTSALGGSTNNGFYSLLQIRGNSAGSTLEGRLSLSSNKASNTVVSGSDLGAIWFQDGSGGDYASIQGRGDGAANTNDYPGRLVFSTTADGASSPTERMRITNTGAIEFKLAGGNVATTNGSVIGSTELFLGNSSTSSGGTSLILLRSQFSVANETKFEVTSEGNVKSRTNSYGSFSDASLKEQIENASSQWSDIKQIKVRNFKFKSEKLADDENLRLIGVIAQEIEQVSPGLVDENAEGIKSVKYSVLYMKAVKALQEAMERIEQLEAKVAALESA